MIVDYNPFVKLMNFLDLIEKEPVVPREYYSLQQQNKKNNHNFQNNNELQNTDHFQVLSYNILAENVAYKFIFFHTALPYLNFKNYRAPRIIDEIKQYLPSIICLQEVDHFEDFYQNQLQNLGYTVYINKRTKFKPHGTLIGFQNDQWDLIDIENLDYNKAINLKEYKVNSNGITALLKSKKSGKFVCASSIHTFYRENQVKYAQVAYTTYHINQFLQKNNLDKENTAIIIAGDFNAQKDQDIIQYLYGNQPQQKDDKNYEKYQWIYQKQKYLCQQKMPGNKSEIDFIFYSEKSLEVTKLLKPAQESYLNESGGTPNKYFSSDHLRIQAEFKFK
ncbi:Endonuclease/exonuclease/phosphatase [Pseudocohnilembus persalinus]|uniref:Endonuclease/exonuclease/phosphatase n=1 Tax=Pseudocohnilembus persalinus TaxID=266149 RepID=A0A0V0QHJ1_PSEPJ|nr:Endonuclease/exonuclease/phosphatase [Pseudocohnilembus persalinus]|eukprot:KRX01646.1 Endonuclease/exonuclease/phosphatase [Pseudocohnilembus persalinus]